MAFEKYDIDTVEGIDELRNRMSEASSVRDWSFILQDYISRGNGKISDNTAIFNMGSATDCINGETEHCQVPFEDCYARKAETSYAPQSLPYRRRQEYLWDSIPPELWAKAFMLSNKRNRKKFTNIRFNESGDFRTNGDIIRVNRIAELLDIDVYTYSASDYLNWDLATNFTINASNDLQDYGDRQFSVMPKDADLPDNTVWCPYSVQQNNGVPEDERRKCGDCKICINKEGPNVALEMH